jgi:4'-phosphopantetheinyl transferase
MGNSPSWFPAAIPPALPDSELHVWRARLDLPVAVHQRLRGTLNSDEKRRADKFLIPEACERFIAARGILRELLGAYLGLPPQRISLIYGPQGKPFLSLEHNSNIRFNVSHSHGIGLFAFANNREIGADLEYVKKDFRGMEIASHFFSQDEVVALTKLPATATDKAFFGCWTRKEAYVKAHGQGLSIPLGSFTIDFVENKQVLRDDAGERWSCYGLEVAPGFAGAVVAEGESWSLKYWEWSPGIKNEALPLVG